MGDFLIGEAIIEGDAIWLLKRFAQVWQSLGDCLGGEILRALRFSG